MKVCVQCLESREITEFALHPTIKGGRLNVCKNCIRFNNRQRYAKVRGKDWLSPEEYKHISYVSKRYRTFYKSLDEVELNIIRIGHMERFKRGCVIRKIGDRNMILIATPKGILEYPLEMTSPEELVKLLKTLNYTIYYVKDFNGQT